ncbi:type II and III secretion system protein [candidate division KSB1 bacterium]|nr:type II and III secretion system protein [candidate division KSB1 bacterium]
MNYKYLFSFGILLIIMLAVTSFGIHAQESIPRQYGADEFVSLDSSVPMRTALDILSKFSSKFDNKILIDPQNHTRSIASINVMVNNMYWKRALEYILRSNLLKYVEREKYYEIVPLGASRGEQTEQITPHTKEIEIHAIFFEADYQTLLETGIDWSALEGGRIRFEGNFGSEVSQDLFNAGYVDSFGNWDVFALLRVFESLNKGEIIANPQIRVLDGQQGKIKVGTDFFLTVRDFAGNTRFTQFESGIILNVIPTIIERNDTTFIHFDIITERSTVFPDPVSVTKATTESRTRVLLLDGEETAIAGLFSNEERITRKGIPILKDLPPWFFGLRYLFGYTKKEVIKKELIILLRAKIVPTIAERMAKRNIQQDFLQQKRREFDRRLRQLKKKNSSSTNGSYGRRYPNSKTRGK